MRRFLVDTGFPVATKSKPRWDLANSYFRGSRQGPLIKKDEILSLLKHPVSDDNLEKILNDLEFQMALHAINTKALDNRHMPTPAEYRATFQDLVENISDIEGKLSALNGFPFDHEIDEHLLERTPEKLPCDVIDEAINILGVIRESASDALSGFEVKAKRRPNIYHHSEMFIGIARIFEQYTGNVPTKYCNESGEGEYAKLVRLCCQKSNIPITSDFCNQIKMAVEKYKNGR